MRKRDDGNEYSTFFDVIKENWQGFVFVTGVIISLSIAVNATKLIPEMQCDIQNVKIDTRVSQSKIQALEDRFNRIDEKLDKILIQVKK